MLNVLVIDDNIFFSKNLINCLIASNDNLKLCRIATDGKEALDIIHTTNIDIILLDLKLPYYNGIEISNILLKENKNKYLNSVIVISGENEMIIKIRNNPLVYSYINKCTNMEKIIEEINKLSKIKEKEYEDLQKNKKRTVSVKKYIFKELKDIGYNIGHVGTKYLFESIYLIYNEDIKNIKLEKNIYSVIANKYGKNSNTVKCDIIRATEQVRKNIDEEKIKKYFGFYYDKKIKPKLVINTILNKVKYKI